MTADQIIPIILAAGGLLWLGASAALVAGLGVFEREPLLRAPQRYSQLTWAMVIAIILTYIGVFSVAMLGVETFAALQPKAVEVPATASAPASMAATSSRPAATSPAMTQAQRAAKAALAEQSEQMRQRQARPDRRKLPLELLADMLTKIVMTVLVAVLVSRVVVGGLAGFGLAPGQILPGLWKGAVGWVVIMPLVFGTSWVTQVISHLMRTGQMPIHDILKALGEGPTRFELGVLLASALVMAPLGEEVFFRGVLQTAMLRTLRRARGSQHDGADLPQVPVGLRWAVIGATSVIFALVHLNFGQAMPVDAAGHAHWDWGGFLGMNWEVLPPLIVLALGLGYVYERTGNLWASMVVHAGFNLVSTVAFLAGSNS